MMVVFPLWGIWEYRPSLVYYREQSLELTSVTRCEGRKVGLVQNQDDALSTNLTILIRKVL